MSTREPASAARAALHLVHIGLKDTTMSHPHRSFTPTVTCIAAVILAFFLAFVEYEHPEGSAAQVNTAAPLFVVAVGGLLRPIYNLLPKQVAHIHNFSVALDLFKQHHIHAHV